MKPHGVARRRNKLWTTTPLFIAIIFLPAATAQIPSSRVTWGFEHPQLDLDPYGRGIAQILVRLDWAESVCVNAATVNVPFAVGEMPGWAGASLYPSFAKFPIPAGSTPARSWNKTTQLEIAWNLDANGANTSHTYNVRHDEIKLDGGPCNVRFWSVNATRPSIDVFLPRRATPTPDPLDQPAFTNLTAVPDPEPVTTTAEPTSGPLLLATLFAMLTTLATRRALLRR